MLRDPRLRREPEARGARILRGDDMDRRRMLSLSAATAALATAGLGLSACGSGGSSIDLVAVGDRVMMAMERFDKALKDAGITNPTDITDDLTTQFVGYLNEFMNLSPALHSTPIAVKMLTDASFDGYADAAGDGAVEGDARLFKVEIDSENNRIILTDANGGSTGMGMVGGLLAGALLGNLLGRQQRAGVRPGSFNNRSVQPASSYARSRARSGGVFGGK